MELEVRYTTMGLFMKGLSSKDSRMAAESTLTKMERLTRATGTRIGWKEKRAYSHGQTVVSTRVPGLIIRCRAVDR